MAATLGSCNAGSEGVVEIVAALRAAGFSFEKVISRGNTLSSVIPQTQLSFTAAPLART